MDDGRHFSNPYVDFDLSGLHGADLLQENNTLAEPWRTKILQHLSRLLAQLEAELLDSRSDDSSIYTGSLGIALCYFNIFQKSDIIGGASNHYLSKATELAKKHSGLLKGHKLTFLCGDAGILACSAVFFKFSNNSGQETGCLHRLLELAPRFITEKDISDELLFGRSGYLQSLLFVQKYFGVEVDQHVIDNVVKAIVESGKGRIGILPTCPLMYAWHDKHYLGAAHGLAGIFDTLMRTPGFSANKRLKTEILKCVDSLVVLKYPSGNYLSSVGSTTDKLVQWCHGAPGFALMYFQAYRIYGEDRFLREALQCADIVWSRGILTKSYGICHGVSGNAYVFIEAFKITGNHMYLYRALKFAEWIFDYGKHGYRTPDRPLSLFEGLAGVIYFLTDILKPLSAEFPGF